MPEKIKVIPCSGMGKVYGLVGRESVLKAVTELCPDKAKTECLAYLVTGDDDAKALVKGQKCITLDGCPAMCAAKSVELAGGDTREKMRVIDAFRRHKGAKPGTATELTEEGWDIVDDIAGDIANKVNELSKED